MQNFKKIFGGYYIKKAKPTDFISRFLIYSVGNALAHSVLAYKTLLPYLVGCGVLDAPLITI